MLYLLEEIFPLIRCRWPPSSGDALRRTSKLGRGTFPILFFFIKIALTTSPPSTGLDGSQAWAMRSKSSVKLTGSPAGSGRSRCYSSSGYTCPGLRSFAQKNVAPLREKKPNAAINAYSATFILMAGFSVSFFVKLSSSPRRTLELLIILPQAVQEKSHPFFIKIEATKKPSLHPSTHSTLPANPPPAAPSQLQWA